MSRTHLTPVTMLLVATVGALAGAQAPAKATPPADSVVKDSVAPKKAGRFGGLVNKAKQVAGNKAVQDAAKGAAMGVACTVVPGAAVATAMTGTGPCANSGLVGMQVAAMRAMQSAMAGGASNAAAQAAGIKLMQSQGLSNAAAAAALSSMMQNPAAAGLSGADAAAALKLMQSMGTPGAGGPALKGNSPNGAAALAAPASPPATLSVNYDFVPGERVIFYSDFKDDKLGDFPARLHFVEGNMEVAELGGRRTLRATSESKLTIPLPEVLPQRFTIEIDVINRPSLDGADFHLRGSVGRVDDAGTTVIGWGSDGVALRGGGGGEVKLANNEANRLRYRGKPAQLRILGDGKYIKVYLDEKRLANVPNANFERSKALHLIIDARSDDNPAYIGRIRVAESRKK